MTPTNNSPEENGSSALDARSMPVNAAAVSLLASAHAIVCLSLLAETLTCQTCGTSTIVIRRSIENTFWCDCCKQWKRCAL